MALNRLLRKGNESRGVAASRNGVVVVSGENGKTFLSRERNCLGRKRAVADDVTEADDLFDALRLGVRKDVLKRREIGVDV